MLTRVLVFRLLPVLIALALPVVALTGARGTGAAAAAPERLPDLDQVTPSELEITHVGPRSRRVYRLGFGSAVTNVGDGPLFINGNRPAADQATMVADQLVEHDGAPQEVVPGVGELRYVVSPDHRHWHLLDFDRYELRRAGRGAATVSDRKTGFCLGDRYPVRSDAPPSTPPEPVYTSRCGLGDPELFGIQEGISVGYGDYYKPTLEGQYLPLSGLRAGRYVLVHRVNADRRLRERDYGNNAASLLLELRWRRGQPEVRVLKQCPDTARCDRRPAPRPRVKTVATGLEIPWEIAFLPDRRALVTERPGRIRLLERDGRLRPKPVATVPVSAQGEGGLLGLAPDPGFARNRFVYLYFTTAQGMRLERWRFSGGRLRRERSLVDGIEAGRIHDSGRIAFGPDRRLYVATGEAGNGELAQRTDSLNGKFLALAPGHYRGAGGRPEIISRGHRNPQGFDWEPGTGRLIATEHGPTEDVDGPDGYDEINEIVNGGNYGWPEAYGFDQAGFSAPLRVYRRPLAPSGGSFVTRRGSPWTGSFVFASLRGEQLRRLEFRNGGITADRPLLRGRFGRLRTVVEGPRGALYVLTSNRDGRGIPRNGDDRILRVTPPRAP
ncbi:MAG: PQQ-dependent sugar dehydrogenase [Actinomycetota bacterium]|nr:PQQ-dependent sugar dehydrogenase [Actinomycetota bacterium]